MKKHSVLLKEELCEGCTNCVKNCPTKAIRVQNGKARIKDELCIDCAECIRICAYHAKHSLTASIAEVANYRYPIALVPPSFYGQFKGKSPLKIRSGLFNLGFIEAWDVSLAAEALSRKTSEFLANHPGTFISSSCPVVVRLIRTLYPELTGQLLPFKAPTDAMAEKVRLRAEVQGVKPEEIGIFLLTPCPGKNTATFDPIGLESSAIDHTISVAQVYQGVLAAMDKQHTQGQDSSIPYLGLGWGQSGGEVKLLTEELQNRSLSVSGIHRVTAVLDELSRDNIKGVKYFELSACEYGCVGGVFNVVNPFQARFNLRRLRAQGERMVEQDYSSYNFQLSSSLEPLQMGQLDSDLERAMEKLAQLEKEIEVLPGLDCAACGAPDCKTLAEDIVTGQASRSDCIFLLRKQVGDLAEKLSTLFQELPPVMRKGDQKK